MPGLSERFTDLLAYPPISRVRRNHGLEHATLYVLAERRPGRPLAGHSDFRGFWIIGDVETPELDAAVSEALQRLNTGESHLAVHPFCGTNLATAGILAGGAAGLAMFGAGRRWRDKLDRLPLAMSMATLALIFAQPLGMTLQREVTTSGVPGALRVMRIIPQVRGQIKAHRVLTEG
ncbi:MAG: hypothetical protein A2W35_14400 [Chloroflexi bacterium RBG_16_57_11]|nr:MAG: hypothetical protein A2W35_14400 [Chloroflexi bacterium RBG_16_57_11]